MNAETVLARYEAIRQKYAQRDLEYDKIKNYMNGAYDDAVAQGSTLRDEPKYQTLEGTTKITANMPYLTVQDNTALCTMDPIIEVPARNNTETAEAQAIRNQKILYATYEHSGGIQLMHDSALYERTYGSSVIGCLPNLKEKRVDWTVYSPRYCYPVFKLGSRVFLRELIIRWQESPDAIRSQYPSWQQEGDSETDCVDVTLYFSETHKIVVAGSQLVSGVKHDWGFVPFVYVPCQPTLDGQGIGDFHQTVGLSIAMNKLLQNVFKYVDENVNADTAIYTDDDLDPPADFGGRKFWKFSTGSKTERMTPTSGQMGEAFNLIDNLSSLHGALTGTTAGRTGQREGMYVSAKGQASLSQPLGNRIDAALRIKAERLSLLCEYTLRLYERHFASVKLDLYGRIGRAHYDVSFKGKDIKGHYRTHIRWLPVILSDASNKQVIGLQLLQSGIISRRTYTQRFLPDVIDPDYESVEIKEERFADAKLELALQGLQQQMALQQQQIAALTAPPPPEGEVPLVNPETRHENNPMLPAEMENMKLEKGKMGPSPGQPMLGAPPQLPPPTGAPTPSGIPMEMLAGGGQTPEISGKSHIGYIPEDVGTNLILLEDVADAVRTVRKIKGRVYLVGTIITARSIDPNAGQSIEIVISDKMDQQTIVKALKQYYGLLEFTVGDMPTEDHVDVTPGTEGYEPMNMGGGMSSGIPSETMRGQQMPMMPGGLQ